MTAIAFGILFHIHSQYLLQQPPDISVHLPLHTFSQITGETKDYTIEEVPQWIDRAYSADLLVQLYDYYGTLKHGFFNSVLGQKDLRYSILINLKT